MDDLKIVLDEVEYVIPASGYTFSPGSQFIEKCIVGVSTISTSSNMIILGDTFLRNYYSAYSIFDK